MGWRRATPKALALEEEVGEEERERGGGGEGGKRERGKRGIGWGEKEEEEEKRKRRRRRRARGGGEGSGPWQLQEDQMLKWRFTVASARRTLGPLLFTAKSSRRNAFIGPQGPPPAPMGPLTHAPEGRRCLGSAVMAAAQGGREAPMSTSRTRSCARPRGPGDTPGPQDHEAEHARPRVTRHSDSWAQ